MSASKASIDPWNEKKNGKLQEHNIKRKIEKFGLVVSTETYNAGTKLENKVENSDKKLGVSEGKLLITVGGEEFTVKPGDVLHIPANT
eukprot:CAMPEP_0168565512 /NCGR_PEP_ID=MMETSP0413-20121227/13886_1 /TAXON_ID=136452 /ORGANISM="Filamoeba nolandi, Strain NC-AS-23-1" /LENGTH=87 /DNA_ID=CAMNT_0008597391 /DNA_START=31 /DNA_END=291 /DNA_ORIENTATION=-